MKNHKYLFFFITFRKNANLYHEILFMNSMNNLKIPGFFFDMKFKQSFKDIKIFISSV